MRIACLVLFLGLFASLPGAQDAAESAPSARTLRRAWKKLDEGQQREVTQWFLFECRSLDTLQARTLRSILTREPEDPGLWPAATPDPIFDPGVHTPGIKSKRKRVKTKSSELARIKKKLLPEVAPDAQRLAFRYRWSTGHIERLADPEDPELVFENAVHGYLPGLDLALAIVLRDLDDGSERSASAAFGHAYANNSGKVFTGVTLFDAIQSGDRVHFPDVDSLGLAHSLFDEWQRWKAPLGPSERKTLYAAISAEFQHVARFRGLREALVEVYLHGDPRLAEGYDGLRVELDAFWLAADSDPGRARAALPGREGWVPFFQELRNRSARDPSLQARARERARRLDAERDMGRDMGRRVLGRGLREFAGK